MDLWRTWATRALALFVVACVALAIFRGCSSVEETAPLQKEQEVVDKHKPRVTFMHTMHLPIDAAEEYQFKVDGARGIRVKISLLSSDYGKLGLPHQGDLRILLDDTLASSWEVVHAEGRDKRNDQRMFLAKYVGHNGWYVFHELARDGEYEITLLLHPRHKDVDIPSTRKAILENFNAFQVFVMARLAWFKRK